MKIDFLKENWENCPLIRLYEFDSAAVRRLHDTFAALADGLVECAFLVGVKSVDGTQVSCVRSMRDRGVVETGSHQFEIALTAEGWKRVAELVESFCKGGSGCQWLTPQTSGIRLLLSKDGAW